MSKNSTSYEYRNAVNHHELSLDHALRVSVHLLEYYREQISLVHSTGKGEQITLTHNEIEVIYNQNLYDKMMKENFTFNCYKSLKRFLRWACHRNEMLSTIILINVLRNLSYCSENCISYLEALKELVLLKDEFSELRRELVFGIPTVADDIDFNKHQKFGFQIYRSIERPSLNYLTSLKVTSNVQSFIRSIMDAVDKNESTAFIMITFFVQMLNSSQPLFNQLITYPSPNHLHENLHDWIFSFVKTYLDQEKNPYSTYSVFRQSKLFNGMMKENLITYEENIFK